MKQRIISNIINKMFNGSLGAIGEINAYNILQLLFHRERDTESRAIKFIKNDQSPFYRFIVQRV